MIFELDIDFYKSQAETKEFFKDIDVSVLKVCTDTREIEQGHFFMAMSGENFDGHDYLDVALKNGAQGFIIKKSLSDKLPESTYPAIIVEDTLAFMQALAVRKLKSWKENGGKVFSLTGSNGKTTNKEILRSLLEGIYPGKIYSTAGNYNNHIGVPLTIFEIKDHHDYAIIEVGTNHPGEIPALCEIAQPDFGFITNIGDSHLEFFKNREGVFNEKRALYDYVMKHSHEPKCFLKNNYDVLLVNLESNSKVQDIGLNCDYQVEVKDGKLRLQIEDLLKEISNKNIREDFNLFNLGMCIQFLNMVFPDKLERILELAENVELPKNNRSVWITEKNKEIFLDAYNANPSSMSASLASFINKLKLDNVEMHRALFILGDMNELGDNVETMHGQMAEYLSSQGVSDVVFVGRYRDMYLKGFKGNAHSEEDIDSLKAQWPKLFEKYDYFFIKGSRSVQLEKLVESI